MTKMRLRSLFGFRSWYLAIASYAAMIAMIVSASAFAYRSLVPAAEGTAAEFA
jgi:hypothetical protein